MKNLHSITGLLTRGLLLAGVALLGPACSEQEPVAPAINNTSIDAAAKSDHTNTFYGPAVPLGQGVGRAWITVNSAGTPLSIGIDVAAKSMLDMGPTPLNFVFQLPQHVAAPPFDHIELGWNPNGHEPEHIYTLPHFDTHFYMISSALQATIPFLAPPAFDIAPLSQYLPSYYMMGPGLVPNMGAHSVDVLSAEFQPGGIFTRTFIYGSYHGNITFLEPMYTLAYLRSLGSETIPIRQPQAFQRAGYYPTSYTISYDDSPKQYHISLNNLTYHPAQ